MSISSNSTMKALLDDEPFSADKMQKPDMRGLNVVNTRVMSTAGLISYSVDFGRLRQFDAEDGLGENRHRVLRSRRDTFDAFIHVQW